MRDLTNQGVENYLAQPGTSPPFLCLANVCDPQQQLSNSAHQSFHENHFCVLSVSTDLSRFMIGNLTGWRRLFATDLTTRLPEVHSFAIL
jgi:hypothetical protein